jgi:hypothetical protein
MLASIRSPDNPSDADVANDTAPDGVSSVPTTPIRGPPAVTQEILAGLDHETNVPGATASDPVLVPVEGDRLAALENMMSALGVTQVSQGTVKYNGTLVSVPKKNTLEAILDLYTHCIGVDGTMPEVSMSVDLVHLKRSMTNPRLNPPPGLDRFYGAVQATYNVDGEVTLDVVGIAGGLVDLTYKPA